MKKILFIENRLKTLLWARLAEEFVSQGLECRFLVQNNLFRVAGHENYIIPFPESNDFSKSEGTFFDKLKIQDRSVSIFSRSNDHYNYYYNEIEKYLCNYDPDVVIGECTLFHELIAIEICKKKNIEFIHPTSCRYPLGRFSLYKYDTLQPCNENKLFEINDHDVALETEIKERSIVPDYIKRTTSIKDSIEGKLKKYAVKKYSLHGRIKGEVYNTPSLFKAAAKDTSVIYNKHCWDSCAIDIEAIDDWNKTVLVPLQLQPEANIDVWGYPYNNQVENVLELLRIIPKSWSVLLKANPKTKYELSSDLLSLLRENDRVNALKHSTTMDDIFNLSKYIYSVTGTINIEAALAGKINISNKFYPVSLFSKKEHIEGDLYGFRYDAEKGSLAAYLRENSFEGIISDPINSPSCISSDNISKITKAFFGYFFLRITNDI
ncbi:hypothetical protein EOPP23_14990 [Endozoicomonas sp. OPT23]|uniref:hypothetical protein n=1 Tax=Endozoicomonas sp. OPT23 TaxID=2072845 RepID=UPI00129B4909|nr:hypothetical protein [Endozoicomonas sp. OPT23]MRI34294.1 hypothetical protein [Endozoicomonas sp. OPT23]